MQRATDARRRAIDVATSLFIEHGYERTSIRQIADAADVSPQTLYNLFESKAGLFAAVMDVVIAGDHEPVPIADRPDVAALRAIDDGATYVRAATAVAVAVLARLEPIYPTLRAAAVSDPHVALAYERFAIQARHAEHRALAARLDELGVLPPGTGVDRAADVLWAVLSPDTFHLLVGIRGWTRDAFEAWAAELLVGSLAPGPARRRGRRSR